MKNLLFYKYVKLNDLDAMREELLDMCDCLDMKGKILLAEEGINGCVSGEDQACEDFKEQFRTIPEFSDIEIKEGFAEQHTFNKLHVKLRDEIITTHAKVDVSKKAPYVEPEELKELLDKEEVIMVDARNKYETKVGKFKNAVDPQIDIFSEWFDEKKLAHLKDKPIVTYCTGGIRCEKASAFLIEKGFTNVRQLHGGIIKYGEKCGNEHWQGKCFVFDQRWMIDIDPENWEKATWSCEL